MRIVADLHIHSKFSRATSRLMNLRDIERFAVMKGLNLIGTGDFTHPKWMKELRDYLNPNDGFYTGVTGKCWFVPSSEVSLVYEQDGKQRKIHILIVVPDLETAENLTEAFSKHGDIESDGRPTLFLSAPEFVDTCTEVSDRILLIPAHIWTPWFSLYGSRSGFDSIDDCFGETVKKIYAVETGLSSDPEMNWRLSELDRFVLVSNSDSHSPYPWRMGREANVFEFKEASYSELFRTLKHKDTRRFLFTIEVDPSYGKYHFDGHRKCGVRFSPEESEKTGCICPVCRKKLTIGVLHRVENLADRPKGFVPEKYIPFKRLLPLYEVLSLTGKTRLHDKLVSVFGNELTVLLETDKRELEKHCDEKTVELIMLNREGKIKVSPGYDGVYGEPLVEKEPSFSPQKSLRSFTV